MLSGSVLHLDEFALHLASLGQVPSYIEGSRGYTVQHFFWAFPPTDQLR